MNAFQLLKNDHKIVSGFFDQIESASGKSKTQLFARLKSELDVHAHVEEKIFYPALENKQESREITLEAYEEHKVVKDLLTELAAGRAADEEWDAKLKVLRENVDHHVEEEEGELFDRANDVLSDDDIERLGNEMEAEKARKQGLPPPARQENGRAIRSGAKPGGPRKQAESPGVLKRLANLVGLGQGASKGSSSKRSSKGSKKAASKGSTTKAGKQAGKKAGAKKTAGKSGRKATGRRAGATRASGSRGASKKTTKRAGGSKKR
jgi:hemerythrin superfamily protein